MKLFYLTGLNRLREDKASFEENLTGKEPVELTGKEIVNLLVSNESAAVLCANDNAKECAQRILNLVAEPSDMPPAGHLGWIFEKLKDDVALWCQTSERNVQTLSVQYEVLREFPTCLCSAAINSSASRYWRVDKTRKRK